MSTTSAIVSSLDSGMKAPVLNANGSNWLVWKARVSLQIGRRGLSAHLRPSMHVPIDPTSVKGFDMDDVAANPSLLASFRAEEKVFLAWQTENDTVVLHVTSGLPDSIAAAAFRRPIAKDLWKWLVSEYEAKGDAYAQEVHRQFEEKRCAAGGDVRAHISEMEELRDRYNASADEAMLDSEYSRTVLASLPDYYRKHVAGIRSTAIALEQPAPKPEALLRAVRVEYDRVSIEKGAAKVQKAADDVALAADAKKRAGRLDKAVLKCYGCGELGHFARDGKCDPAKRAAYEASKPVKANAADASSSAQTAPAATDVAKVVRARSPVFDVAFSVFVRDDGASVPIADLGADSSSTPHANPGADPDTWLDGLYDEDEAPLSPQDVTGIPLSAMLANERAGDRTTAEVVDSGASRHMSSLGSRFLTLKNIPPHPIVAAEGATFYATAVGDYVFSAPQEDGTQHDILLRDTLYSPSLRGTLISVSSIDKGSGEVRFSGGTCKIFDINRRVVGVVPRLDGLYQVQRASEGGAYALYARAAGKRPLTWMELHRVLGHVSPAAAKAQYLRGGLKGVVVDETSELFDCEPCTMGKLRAAQIPKVREGPRSTKFGEWWYSDIWGPSPVETPGRKRWAETYIDDATHWRELFLYRNKDDAELNIMEFDAYLENQLGIRMKLWVTDQAGEYKDKEVLAYLRRRGVLHPMTSHDTHQQVGVVERWNRTLFERVRACLYASGLPRKLWGECANHCTWLLNSLGTRANPDGKSPYEMRYGFARDISGVPEWGAPCYVFDLKTGKLEPNAERVFWLGFDTVTPTKGHRLWSKKKQSVRTEPAVKFLRVEPDREEDVHATDVGDLFWEDADPGEAEPARNEAGDGAPVADPVADPAEVNPPQTPPRDPAPLPIPGAPARAPAARRFTSRIEEVDEGLAPDVVEGPRVRKPSQYVRDLQDGVGVADGRRGQPQFPRGLQVPPAEEPAEVAFANAQELFGYEDFAQALVAQHADPQRLEPASHAEVLARPDAERWIEAEQAERTSLKEKQVYEWVSRDDVKAKGRKTVGSKWVYRGKRDAAGKLVRHKARLVAQGFSTIPGVDYTDTTSPVVTMETLRFVLSAAALFDWELEQIDFETAFLNGKLDREVFLEPPPGYDDDPMHPVRLFCWLLLKALYGLKDAGLIWYRTLVRAMTDMGFRRCLADMGLFVLKLQNSLLIVAVSTDDCACASPNAEVIAVFKEEMGALYEIKDLGGLHFLLGVEVVRDRERRTLTMSQGAYVDTILGRHGMTDCRTYSTPMDVNARLSPEDSPKTGEEYAQTREFPYREMVGSLVYLVRCTRPDLALPVSILSQFLDSPGLAHIAALKRVYGYVKLTRNVRLLLGDTGDRSGLVGFTDSDGMTQWHRRAMSGYVFRWNGGTIAWSTKKQELVALSTTEAEYVAQTHAAKQAMWLRTLVAEVLDKVVDATPIHADNDGAIKLTQGYQFHARTKHIDIRYHFIRYLVESGDVRFVYCKTSNMVADIMTKPLPSIKFKHFASQLGLVDATA